MIKSPYLNITEAAEFLSVKVPTLRARRQNGTGPKETMIGSLVRYTKEDLEAWVASQNEDK